MNTSEVLYGAADHIDRYGHRKHGLHGAGDPLTAPACALGAIHVGAGIAGTGSLVSDDTGRAYSALRQHVAAFSVVSWNNADERTASEVVEALRAAAVIESAKETADERESVHA